MAPGFSNATIRKFAAIEARPDTVNDNKPTFSDEDKLTLSKLHGKEKREHVKMLTTKYSKDQNETNN